MKRVVRILLVLATFNFLSLYGCSASPEPEYKFPSSSTDDEEDPADPVNTYFKDEVRPAESAVCFPGAYYHKCVSSKDVWLGIGGTVVLPEITFDQDRTNPAKPGQYLDNPSVYLGGNMGGQETDIGMSWEVIRKEDGSVSAERLAFRPFLRRTACGTQTSAHYMSAPAQKEYYWYPGDEITMYIQVVRDGVIKFVVDGEGKHYETEYECAGYTVGGIGEFKRVNAIDQVSNEGKPVQATRTEVKNSEWKESWLLREHEGNVVRAPMHTGRYTDMRCPDVKYFNIVSSDEDKKTGAERIDINGAGY